MKWANFQWRRESIPLITTILANIFCSTPKPKVGSSILCYKVESWIGTVAYKLWLPDEALIHPVFHILQLKRCLGYNTNASTTLPNVDKNRILQPKLEEILDRRVRLIKNRFVTKLLVRWLGQTSNDATWESFHKLNTTLPHLVDNVFLKGG